MTAGPETEVPGIAIIGMACRFAGADDAEQFWANLVDGVEAVTRGAGDETHHGDGGRERYVRAIAALKDIDLFDADYFRVPPAEAAVMDPQHRVLLEVAESALENAGYAGDREAVVGVFVGCGENHYLRQNLAPHAQSAGTSDDGRILLANEKDFLAPRLAFKLGFTGPAVTVQTSCATALTAVALACTALAAGDCDIALAGGVSLLMPDIDGYTYTPGGILSADGRCRTFDAAASGTVPGSGAGIVVLKRDSAATADRDRRRSVIRGWAINNDGGSRAGFTVPKVGGQEAVIRAALVKAGVSPEAVGYVEAHGTGTLVGDPLEFEALRRVFAGSSRPEQTLALGAVKPNIGHTDTASGVAGLIKAAFAVERGLIPATLHFTEPNADIEFDATPFFVSAETVPWKYGTARVAGVSAFGVGGSNAHVILEQAQPEAPVDPSRTSQILVLSAHHNDALEQMRIRLAEWLERQERVGPAELADVAFTLAAGRPHLACRWAAVVKDGATAIDALREPRIALQSTARWVLGIHGTSDELAAMGRCQDDPLLRTANLDLSGSLQLERASAPQAGALTALVAVRALQTAGLEFARIEAPTWMLPAVRWLTSGADPVTLETALQACSDDDDAGDGRAGTGRLLIGPSFELPEVIAAAWAASAHISWADYYGDERRGRVPLPTYPFARRRFWIDRTEPGLDLPGAKAQTGTPKPRAVGDLIAAVSEVWRAVLGVGEIAPDAHFIDDLAGDSMYAVEIGARLNEHFAIDLPVDLPFMEPTITGMAEYIEVALMKGASSLHAPI